MDIPLGFEVGSGEQVWIPVDHLLIAGRTRQSGKTTTLEAIAERTGLRALTFLTKRGEDTFADAHHVQPYFHDQGGWQFVSSVLEASLGEKLKKERAEIINACRGARSLREVYDRIVAKKATSKSGWVIDVLTGLEAYLDIVLPELERTPFAKTLQIGPGSNVIDLSRSDYSEGFKALVIRSALEWILRHEKGVLTVIPEAGDYIPQGRGSPVKRGCEQLIRKGGVLNNWVAIDSQEITAVDKSIAKSCGVWILGVQREMNEVKRVIDQLPGRPKPTPDEVMQLGLGQFYVSYTGARTRKCYVQPVWMDASMAHAIATGGLPVSTKPVVEREEDDVPQEALDRVTERLDNVLGRLDRMLTVLESGPAVAADRREAVGLPEPSPIARAAAASLNGDVDEEALYQRFRARAMKDPVVLKVLTMKPEIVVEVKTETIAMDGASLPGRVARLIAGKFFDTPKRHTDVRNELQRTGPPVHGGDLSKKLKELVAKGFLTLEGESYQSVREMKVRVVSV